MKTTLHILVFLFLAAGATRGLAQSPQTPAEWRLLCDSLVSAARAGDPNTDFGLMRTAYARSDYYEPYEGVISDYRDSMKSSYQVGDYEGTAEWVKIALIADFPDLYTHYYAALANEQLGDEQQLAHHRWVTYYLAHSIMASGDGTSDSTAWKVISIEEEHALLGFLKYIEENADIRYHLTTRFGQIDQVAGTDVATGERRIFYFNVDIPMAWLAAHPGVYDRDDPDSIWEWLDDSDSTEMTPEDSAFYDSLVNDTL